MKKRFTIFGLTAAIMMLTSCASVTQDGPSSARLFQPAYLSLEQGQTIQTKDGIYTAQVPETWVALWQYQSLEDENLALSAALRKLQAREDMGK